MARNTERIGTIFIGSAALQSSAWGATRIKPMNIAVEAALLDVRPTCVNANPIGADLLVEAAHEALSTDSAIVEPKNFATYTAPLRTGLTRRHAGCDVADFIWTAFLVQGPRIAAGIKPVDITTTAAP